MNTSADLTQQPMVTKLKYELTTTRIDDLDQMSYTTYGIRATEDSGNVIASYPDISTAKEFVEEFLDLLESHDVAAVHIRDILEDYMD